MNKIFVKFKVKQSTFLQLQSLRLAAKYKLSRRFFKSHPEIWPTINYNSKAPVLIKSVIILSFYHKCHISLIHYSNLTLSSIIHCDLKPENILLVNPKRSLIKVGLIESFVYGFNQCCSLDNRFWIVLPNRKPYLPGFFHCCILI